MWSPELELLDLLLGDDESLSSALKIFGWPEDPTALELARHSIINQIKDGLIELKQRADGSDRVLPEWEAAQVLRDDANWLTQRGETDYYVGLTNKGAGAFHKTNLVFGDCRAFQKPKGQVTYGYNRSFNTQR